MALEQQMGRTTSCDKLWVVGLHRVSFLPCDKSPSSGLLTLGGVEQ